MYHHAIVQRISHNRDDLCLLQVMKQSDERSLNGSSARSSAFDALVDKYCHGRQVLPQTSQEVEAELARHVRLVERKADILANRLEQVRGVDGGYSCRFFWDAQHHRHV